MTVAEQSTPVHGIPCWVSLMTRDLRDTQDFYGTVLGWSFRSGTLGEGFTVALVDGLPVAGIGQIAPGLPTAVSWTPYFAVENADATTARVRERGGTIAVGPIRLGPGRGAVAADREGAGFGFWEGRTPPWSFGRDHPPASLELRTSHAFDSAIFYAEVFDWASEEPGGCEVGYAYQQDTVVVRQGGRTVATLRGGGDASSPDPPVDSPADGTEAVIRDPDGGIFTVCAHPPDPL
ncbi:VOC family protein [Streptomyces anulatus]|uniref:VOC family protein n=1 Tax=Streptomyces anulatus TaxID=1892 RepID=UPI002E34C3C1|nr:VOC family protein [Streptomyces anulatus]